MFEEWTSLVVTVAAVVTATTVLWTKVLKPVADAAAAVRRVADQFPYTQQQLAVVADQQQRLTERHEQIMARLQAGDARMAGLEAGQSEIIRQVANGDPTRTLVDRVSTTNRMIEQHVRDDAANFRALGHWSAHITPDHPFEPVAGIDSKESPE